MNGSSRRSTALLFALLAGIGLAAAGCGGGANSAAVNVPPASSHTAAAKAATLTWLDQTSQMWVASDFAALDQVTTGEMRTSTRSKSSTRRCPRTRTGCRSS